MIGSEPVDRRLGPLSRDVLRVLIEVTEEGDGLTRDRAVAVVRDANAESEDRFWADDATHLTTEVEGVINGLLNRGYLYEAGGELYVTDRTDLQ